MEEYLIVDCETGTVISAAEAMLVKVSDLPLNFDEFTDEDYVIWAKSQGVPIDRELCL